MQNMFDCRVVKMKMKMKNREKKKVGKIYQHNKQTNKQATNQQNLNGYNVMTI